MVESLLREQQTLTAVERFAQSQPETGNPAAESYYRDLIPAGHPAAGEQYAFEVDLDVCSGCKACVVACHNRNGLEEDEAWRGVGMLVGGDTEQPFMQHVTTACHHCVEPACAQGCPVNAYIKDDVTGIVHHLDDQCIGCQYCIFKCPYDVPVYSPSKGIVRKCDMCHQRLSVGEAPACVQGCPNQAIQISIIKQTQVREESETHLFLPGAPQPSHTLPTTQYRTERVMPRNTLPGDYFSVQRSHGHLPLVVMLVLTQMSVGAFVVEHAMYSYFSVVHFDLAAAARPWHLCAALVLALLGLLTSVFHLGRPRYAYRSLLALRTSWLSREILAFGVFATAATAYVAVAAWHGLGQPWTENLQNGFGAFAAMTGLVAVMCSVMVYVDTRRPLWTPTATTCKFFLTAFVLGIPVALLVSLVTAAVARELTVQDLLATHGRDLCRVLIAATVVKLLFDVSVLAALRQSQYTPQKRSALLLCGPLSMVLMRRLFFGVVGGVGLPLLLLSESSFAHSTYHPLYVGVTTALMLVLLSAGELHERFLFFAASVAPRMPGGPAS